MQQQRVEFWQLVQGILAQDLIFIDESGVNLSLVRLFARSPTGQRAYGSRPQKRGKNVSLISAIALKGVITQVSLLGATIGDKLRLANICQETGWGSVKLIADKE